MTVWTYSCSHRNFHPTFITYTCMFHNIKIRLYDFIQFCQISLYYFRLLIQLRTIDLCNLHLWKDIFQSHFYKYPWLFLQSLCNQYFWEHKSILWAELFTVFVLKKWKKFRIQFFVVYKGVQKDNTVIFHRHL